MNKTQPQKIVDKVLKDKQISNVWAVNHHIYRLSERMAELEGKRIGKPIENPWKFKREWKMYRGRRTGEYIYHLVGKSQ